MRIKNLSASRRNRRRTRPLVFEQMEFRLLLTAEIEPNNTLASANSFGSPSDTLTGRIANINDVDYFSRALLSGDTLRFRYTGNDTDGTPAFLPTMEILDSAGEVKTDSLDAHTFSFTAAKAGTYSLRLTSQSIFGNVTGDYAIEANVDAFSGVTEIESNNTQLTANVLPGETNFRGSLATVGDIDYFRFSAAADQAVVVKFAEKLSANPAIRLYSPTGSLLATNQSGEGIFAQLTQSGTFAVAIQSDNSAGAVTGDYVGQLLIAAEPTTDLETGNSFEAATVLDLGPYIVPSLYLSSNAGFGSHGLTGSYLAASQLTA